MRSHNLHRLAGGGSTTISIADLNLLTIQLNGSFEAWCCEHVRAAAPVQRRLPGKQWLAER